MIILLLGKNGQVGWELQRSLAPLGKLIALDSKSTQWCGDLSQPEQLAATIRTLRPDIIVNAAAYTAVDKAETDALQAKLINTDAVEVIAAEAKSIGALLVHYSTDYVYPGDGNTPWGEEDQTAPANIYGQTKRAGEQAIEQAAGNYLIFRTSWVYAAKGNNFAKTMLRLAQEKEKLSIINDQIGAPTGAELIADATAHAIRHALRHPEVRGIYHLAAKGSTSWYEYAKLVFDIAREHNIALAVQDVSAIPTSAYPTPASRPLNSRLALNKIEQTFGLTMPEWQIGVRRVLDELLAV
ncbi:dTDP-4-dehydrorhamnose reductase [Winslowiella toletana]|nr:dTDP-4-dehydrorhamnose reductase [Winslowiella toletana]